jgi:tRNA(Ile)-lysidine synthase
VRRELIPVLERDFPKFSVESLCALNESALEVAELLQQLADRMWTEGCVRAGRDEVLLDAGVFARTPAAVRKVAVARAVAALFPAGDAPALRSEHYRDGAALAEADTGTELSLPRGVKARREHGVIYFRRGPEPEPFTPRELPLPGGIGLPELRLRVECEIMPEGTVSPEHAADLASDDRVYVSLDAVQLPLTLRSRRPGDRFHPLGAPGEARLKEFLINSKVPQHERDRIPLVTDNAGRIVWVVGHRIGHPFRLTSRAQRVARLRVRELGARGPRPR